MNFLPPKGKYINISSELMGHFARNLWQRLWAEISREIGDEQPYFNDAGAQCAAEERLAALDRDGSGFVTVEDIKYALKEKLGYSIDNREDTLAKFVHSYVDQSGDGRVTKKDFLILSEQMMELECKTAAASMNKKAEDDINLLHAGKMGLVATLEEGGHLLNHQASGSSSDNVMP